MDEWGTGCYEDTAVELAPVSEVAIAALGLCGGDRILDVACGTGNAALAAHNVGALVTGLDGSPRLLAVARERVPNAECVLGDATQLPFEDGRFDAAVSVFGVIFARPAKKAAHEIARTVRRGGRVAVTAWLPCGPTFAAVSLMSQAIARVRPPEGPPPVHWGDRRVLETLLGPYGDLEISERRLAREPVTAEEQWDRWERLHPTWINARRLLEPVGQWKQLREASITALREGGLGTEVARPYLLAVLTR